MSPLVDVTNSGGVNCIVADKTPKKLVKKGSHKCQKKKITLSDQLIESDQKLVEETHAKLSSGSPKHTKMCNTQVKNSSGCETSHRGSLKGISQGVNGVESLRVPPLPQTSADDMLSQAVQALSISPLAVHTKPNGRLVRQYRKQNGRRIGRSSCGYPENPESYNGTDGIQTPHQCGACGLEFTSLPVLTQHLAKHVYDGLYAAQWLTQAMAMVSTRQPSSDVLLTSTVHNVPSDEGDSMTGSQSTQLSPPSGSNH